MLSNLAAAAAALGDEGIFREYGAGLLHGQYRLSYEYHGPPDYCAISFSRYTVFTDYETGVHLESLVPEAHMCMLRLVTLGSYAVLHLPDRVLFMTIQYMRQEGQVVRVIYRAQRPYRKDPGQQA